jgi:hypothetical protein
MTAPLPPRLLDIEDGVYVAGTHDVQVALSVAVAGHERFKYLNRETPADQVAKELFEQLVWARTTWSRQSPAMRGSCPCGEGHAWDLTAGTAGTRGSFRVVWWD